MKFKTLNDNKIRTWTKLDNAGKLFPCVTSRHDTKVFRFICELYEDITPLILQDALDETMKHFPLYRSIIKKGLFWYYLESCDLKPTVQKEDKPPCSQIYDPHKKNLLFNVTYYRKRINLEIFHSLSDGTGALNFIKMLVYFYLIKAHADELGGNIENLDYDTSPNESMSDSFEKYYKGEKQKKKKKRITSYKVKGTLSSENRLNIIEGVLDTSAVLNLARSYNTTVTVFLTALLMCKIHEGMHELEKKHPVVISVPVNLRNFFDSQSSRNFFSVINLAYDFNKNSEKFEDIIAFVKNSFSEMITRESLTESMNHYASFEHKIYTRIVPLPIKVLSIKLANKVFANGVTASLSNVAKIKMPDQISSYIHMFDVFFSTDKLQVCMCSYENNMTVSFSSPYVDTDIQRSFFRALSDMGVTTEIATNLAETGEEEKDEILPDV